MKRLAGVLLLSLLCSGLISCAWGIGTRQIEQPTTGRELMDLKEALDSGAISEEEYQETKQRILRIP